MSRKQNNRTGFSLIELVIVVVIIAIIGAIAIPRMSRGAAGASDSAVKGDLQQMRTALDIYAGEHGNSFPAFGTITTQLTEYTDDQGNVSATKDATHIYGPYMRSIPTLPVGPATFKGTSTFIDGSGGAAPGATAGAWLYNYTTGTVQANLDATAIDTAGNAYNTY
jgi:prepilin-type N-terminal cleavage/methylation domain-containing protein